MLSLALLAGAVINSLRFEVLDTGELPYGDEQAALRGLRRFAYRRAGKCSIASLSAC